MFIYLELTVEYRVYTKTGMQLNHIDLSLKKCFPRTEYSVEFGGHTF